jgi:iron complex transport system ATP-binding protein
MGVCVVTHDLNLASLYCERLVLLSGGGVVKEGAPGEVLEEGLLRSVYGEGLAVSNHPEIDRPIVLPAGDTSGSAACTDLPGDRTDVPGEGEVTE